MPKQYADYVTGEDGEDRHPAFGIARIGRIQSHPGAVLFQSDLHHAQYIQLTVSTAVRKRALKDDRVYAEKTLVQVSMSMAQFASLIASVGTEGIPVTIEYDHGDLPGLTMQPRLALTNAEVHAAAQEAFEAIQAAEAAYEQALADKAPAVERNRLLRDLRAAIRNAAPNVDFAAKKLAEHAEEVVELARADVEAMVASATAGQLPPEAVAAVTSGASQ